jgi:hypothetical protein
LSAALDTRQRFIAGLRCYGLKGFGGRTLPLLREPLDLGNSLFEDIHHDNAPVSGHVMAQLEV